MRLLLDTHALLWWLLGDSRLSKVAAVALGQTGTLIVVSAISGHEIATKQDRQAAGFHSPRRAFGRCDP